MAKTEAQKAARRKRRKAYRAKLKEARPAQRQHGEEILKAAMKAGYLPQNKKFYGKGDYSARMSIPMPKQHVLRGKGDLISDAVNFGAGVVEGGVRKGWNALKSFFGMGDYSHGPQKVSNNSFFQAGIPPVIGSAGSPGMQSTRVMHKEFIGTVKSSSSFTLQSFNFNPGLPNTFPWCSTIASAFQRWKPLGAMLVYEPNIDAYGGANINGKVVLATRYGVANEPAPVEMTEMENCQYSVSGRPGNGLVMAIECAPSKGVVNNLLVRTGSYTGGESLTFFDHCLLDVATQGQADATATLGSLYIVYDLQFEMPFDVAQAGSLVTSDHVQCATVTTGVPLGATQTKAANSSLGGTTTGTTYTFPAYINAGSFLVEYNVVAATSVSGSAIIAATSGCTLLTAFSSSGAVDAVNQFNCQQSAASTVTAVVQITAASAVVTFTGAGTISGAARADLFVTPIDADIITLTREARMFKRQIKEKSEEVKRNDELIRNSVRDIVAIELEKALSQIINAKEEDPNGGVLVPPVQARTFEPAGTLLQDELRAMLTNNTRFAQLLAPHTQ